ncbi:hypothetical protein MY11210_000818 [Beauveria gryllotalpidicola]
MSAAAAPPPPPPPGGSGGAGPGGHKGPRRSVDGVLVVGDSDDEMFGPENEEHFPCLTCLGSAKVCNYDSVLFANNPRLRYAVKKMKSLINNGKAIKTAASGKKREKGYKYPVATDEFARAIVRYNTALNAARANPRAAQDAFSSPPAGDGTVMSIIFSFGRQKRAEFPFGKRMWHGALNKYQQVEQLGGRFVSEFGMEAYPHLSTTQRMTTKLSQLYPGSMVLDFHNKGIGHERRMMTYIAENFRVRTDLASYTHLTQVVQAEAMRFSYKTWRCHWGKPGARRCGGVLVWQLNDCWPTMSWAVLDYYLVKKPAYYAVARALRPIDVGVVRTYHDWTQTGYYIDDNSKLCTGQVDQTRPARGGTSTFSVWAASSSVDEVDAIVTIRFISVRTGKDVQPAMQRRITVGANCTTDIIKEDPLAASIQNPEDEVRPFDTDEYDPYVVHARLTFDGGSTAVTDTAWPDPVKFLDMADRGVSFDVSDVDGEVTVTAQRPVKAFVFEEVEGLKLSDNGFDLLPGEKQVVKPAKDAPQLQTFADILQPERAAPSDARQHNMVMRSSLPPTTTRPAAPVTTLVARQASPRQGRSAPRDEGAITSAAMPQRHSPSTPAAVIVVRRPLAQNDLGQPSPLCRCAGGTE